MCQIVSHAARTYSCRDHFSYSCTHIPLPHLTAATHTSHAANLVSINEAWHHFTDGWLIPQMYQPDQSPIYCKLISALTGCSPFLQKRERERFATKIWAVINVCVCVPYGWGHSSSPSESPYCILCINLHALCECAYLCEFMHLPQLACNYLFMFNKVRRFKEQVQPPLFL